MKNKIIGNEIKWYHPFKLIKRNKELEKLSREQFNIISKNSDELKEKEKQIKKLEEIIKSLKEDEKSILEEVEVKPKKATTKKTASKTATTKKTTTKKTTAKKATTKKKEENDNVVELNSDAKAAIENTIENSKYYSRKAYYDSLGDDN